MPRAPDGTDYDLTGPQGAPVVALIHGLGLARGVWDGIGPHLSGFRVMRYDLPGHGASAPLGQPATLRAYAAQLALLLDHLQMPRAHICGFSIGGMINRRFALDHPHRTASLVILNAPHDRGPEAQEAVEARARAARDQGSGATMEAALQRWFTEAAPERMRARVRAWRMGTGAESYADAAWVLARGVRELIAPAPPIGAPTLVMTSADDVGSTPAMSRAIANEIAGAECEIVAGLKHLGLMERPTAFGPSIRAHLLRQERLVLH